MPKRTSEVTWSGDLKRGNGRMRVGGCELDYTAGSRFEQAAGSNPEELIAAAHAGCFSMALAGELAKEGHPPRRIDTRATVTIEREDGGYRIPTILLDTEVDAPGIDERTFLEVARRAKDSCPVSRLVQGAEIRLDARLAQLEVSS